MSTRRDSLRTFFGLALLSVGIGTVDDAEAARKKRVAPKKSARRTRAAPPYLPDVSSIVLLVQQDGFKILSQDEPHARRTPASIVKLMTLCLLFDALEGGRLNLNDKITMTSGKPGGGELGLRAGAQISVSDAILAIVVKSANDVALSVAEHLAGTEEEFARQMTTKGREIGMRNTKFTNAHGMRDPGQYSTAFDLAMLSLHLIRHHANHYHYFSTGSFIFQGVTHRNHNGLMREYEGMDGLKTGWTNDGRQVAVSAERPKPADPVNSKPPMAQRLIGVFMGARSNEERNQCLGYLLDQGFITEGHDIGTSSFRYSTMACTSARNKVSLMP